MSRVVYIATDTGDNMKKTTLKQQAYDLIKSKIIYCEYAPGTILNEDMLGETIKGSRTPIRDAIGRLEQEGLVTILPKKGILVSELSISEVTAMFETRFLLEPYAIEKFGSRIDPADFTDYYQNFLSFQEDPEAYTNSDKYNLDNQFHQGFIDATQNRYITSIYEQVTAQNTRLRVLTGSRNDARLTDTQKEHLLIAELCLKQDWTGAANAMRQHIKLSKNVAFELLLKKGDWII